MRYARKTSLTLKETAKVFRLRRNRKKTTDNAENAENAENFMQRSYDSTNVDSRTLDDLEAILEKLQTDVTSEVVDITQLDHINHKSSKNYPTTLNNKVEKYLFNAGEHITAAWLSDDGSDLCE